MRTPTVEMIAAGMGEYEFTDDVVTNIYSAILDAARAVAFDAELDFKLVRKAT